MLEGRGAHPPLTDVVLGPQAGEVGTAHAQLADQRGDRFVFADAEQLALVGFLAGCRGATRDAYRMDLRLFAAWCAQHDTALFGVQRMDIECYARDLEAHGRARATVARRLCTVAGFYRYAEQEGLIDRSPAVHVRRPRLDYESRAVGLDRNELDSLLVAAGLAGAREPALISLLGLNGLRISEALCVDIGDLSVERGHRTVTVVRKGGKVVTMLLAPRVARAMDLAIGDRAGGPVFLAASGRRMDRHAASRIVRHVARAAGLDKHISPHSLRHAFITPLRHIETTSGKGTWR